MKQILKLFGKDNCKLYQRLYTQVFIEVARLSLNDLHTHPPNI